MVLKLIAEVGLQTEHIDRYPHEFSGGQRQRIGIARASALNPKVIICDEPVSALDVSVQAQMINLLRDLQEAHNLTYLFISHDLGVVKHISTRIAVMYLGQLVVLSNNQTLYSDPKHPYTRALLSASPIPNPRINMRRIILKGDVTSPIRPPEGCRFHTRCPERSDACKRRAPEMTEVSSDHWVMCSLYD
jgi:oligopeptide/dipeptide ABC transporter ATP-binding protein